MTDLHRIIVVDHGERNPDYGASLALAELGYATVTTSLDAAEEVLALMQPPDAFVFDLPRETDEAVRLRFEALAEKLRASRPDAPVIIFDRGRSGAQGGYAALLQGAIGSCALAGPSRI